MIVLMKTLTENFLSDTKLMDISSQKPGTSKFLIKTFEAWWEKLMKFNSSSQSFPLLSTCRVYLKPGWTRIFWTLRLIFPVTSNFIGGSNGSGLAFCARNELKVLHQRDLESSEIEGLWLEVFLPKSRSFLVGKFYRPPSSSNNAAKEFLSVFESSF